MLLVIPLLPLLNLLLRNLVLEVAVHLSSLCHRILFPLLLLRSVQVIKETEVLLLNGVSFPRRKSFVAGSEFPLR